MDPQEMTRRMQELKRQEAIERAKKLGEEGSRQVITRPEPERPEGQGPLTRARVQGQHRWYVGGRWIRTGETLEVFVGGAWVRGRFDWRPSPKGDPSLFIAASDPDDPDYDREITLRLELAEGVVARVR